MAHKILRQGYFWPTLQKDTLDFVRRCHRCQRNANIQRRPSVTLTSIGAPWLFAQWGIDILGPFPLATGQRKFLVVSIDYFTKWVEAEPVARITEQKMRNFVWKSIICRFGLPRILISDNGRQFDNIRFREFCSELGIDHRFTSVAHPQTNEETEVTNRTILQGLKAGWTDPRGNGLKTSTTSCGSTEQYFGSPLARPPLTWHTEWKLSFLWKSGSPPQGLSTTTQPPTPPNSERTWTSSRRPGRRPEFVWQGTNGRQRSTITLE